MKAMSRDFTLKEKIMLIILGLILIGLAYYRFVHIPCKNAVEEAHSQRDVYQAELQKALVKESQMRKMKEELDEIGELNEASRMESYSNSKAEIALLNRVLESATDYSISFSGVTKTDDQIRRNFSLTFTTRDFATAKKIITELAESEYRCLIGDIQYTRSLTRAATKDPRTELPGQWIDDVYYYEQVSVNATATFYETMYGGTPDAGLNTGK